MGRGKKRNPKIFGGPVKRFYFEPKRVDRAFDIMADFRAKAREKGWTKREARNAISSAIGDGCSVEILLKNLYLAAGLDKNGMML